VEQCLRAVEWSGLLIHVGDRESSSLAGMGTHQLAGCFCPRVPAALLIRYGTRRGKRSSQKKYLLYT
jgi:hypothetical protein